MATTSTVQLNVTGNATQQLSKIKTQVDNVGKSFQGLRNVLGSIAITSIIQNTLKWANSIQDVADSTGFATEAIVGFTRAVQQNGGTAENATNAMNKFILTINEAAEGGYKTQKAFGEVGVTLEDLRTLSEQDLFEKTIKGLATIQDRTRRAAVANEIFGKSLRTVKLDGLGGDYQVASKESEKYTNAIKAADKTSKQLAKTMEDFRIALLAVLQPVLEFTSGITSNIETISRWLKIIFAIGAAIVSVTLLGRAFRAIVAIFQVFSKSGQGVARTLQIVWHYIKRITGLINVKNPKVANPYEGLQKSIGYLIKDFKILAGVSAGAVAFLMPYITKFGEEIKKLVGVDSFDATKPLVIMGKGAERMPKDFFEKGRFLKEQRQIQEALAKEKEGILQIAAAYKRNSDERLRDLDIQKQQIRMSDDQIEVMDSVNEVIKQNKDAIQQLRDAQSKLEKDNPLRATYDEAISAIRKLLPIEVQATEERIKQIQQSKNEFEELIKDIELLNNTLSDENSLNALRRQSELIGLTGDALAEKQIQLQIEEELQNRLLEIEKRRNELAGQAEKLGKDKVQAEIDRLTDEERLAREFADRKLAIEKDLHDKTKALRNDTAHATKQFLEELARSTDPAILTTKKWEATFSGIEDAINTLTTTGKFNFKDFALSIIADLLKIQMRAIVVQAVLAAIGAIFGGAKPTANVGSSLFPPGTRAAAKGANALAGQPFLIGEQGPELFVPKTAGTIVPNNKLGAQGNTQVTNVVHNYNISAVDAKSVAQLFAENRKSLLGAVGMAQKEMPYMMMG